MPAASGLVCRRIREGGGGPGQIGAWPGQVRAHDCRHLPVLEHGELVGVLTQRDLYLLETIAGVDLTKDHVDDAMSTDAYAVPPDAPLDEVAGHMATQKYGCAVVIERGRVIGIFTTTDALRVLAGMVR